MARISKVGHVVLGVRDSLASAKFYNEALGMEIVNTLDLDGKKMTFLSFGERDHDIAVLEVPADHTVGSPGFSHTALEIEGGIDQLNELYEKDCGVEVEMTADHILTKSFYFMDPDGNRIELFAQALEQKEARQVLEDAASASDLMKPLELGATR